MTSNTNLKAQARAYAVQHGVSYTQARREILATASDNTPPVTTADPLTRRVFSIQQAELPSGVLPYPFHVHETGFVDRQDFWRGNPFRLVGFANPDHSYTITVDPDEFFADPTTAIGLEPVFSNRDTNFVTYTGLIVSVDETTTQVAAPESVMASVNTVDGAMSLSFGVGHLMRFLNDSDFNGSTKDGNVTSATASAMLGWLLGDPAGQNLDALDRLFTHIEKMMEAIGDDSEDTTVVAPVFLDGDGVRAWVENRYGV